MGKFEAELRKFVAPEFVFGDGAQDMVGRYVKNLGGTRVFVVTDAGIRAAGWTDRALKKLADEGVASVVFSDVTSNPKETEVMAGVELYKKEKCDFLVAVGGGSPIDCAKAIGIVSSNGGSILDYEGVDRILIPCPPLVCIPTTPGSAADISQFAIITDTIGKRKIAIISKALVPEVSLIDPGTVRTLSPLLIAAIGSDTLVHGIEAYVSVASSPVTDLFALEAIRLVSENLVPLVHDPGDHRAQYHMMLATLEAGMAFSNASLGLGHAMAHSLGGYFDRLHGEMNAYMLRPSTDFNFDAVPERYRTIAATIGIDVQGRSDHEVKAALLGRFDALLKSAGLRIESRMPGVDRETISILAENAMKDPCLITNPRQLSKKDIEALYENVFQSCCGAGKAS